MKLPNAHLAVASRAKVLDYLLCPWHRNGGPKHRYFSAFGYARERWEIFASDLCTHAREHDVVETEQTAFGTLYVIEGHLRAPDGRLPFVRSVWSVSSEKPLPRLITAYPAPSAREPKG